LLAQPSENHQRHPKGKTWGGMYEENKRRSLVPARDPSESGVGMTATAHGQSNVAIKGGVLIVLSALVIYKFAVRDPAQSGGTEEGYSAVLHALGSDAEMGGLNIPKQGGNIRRRSSLT
jgi:hypothetical protein